MRRLVIAALALVLSAGPGVALAADEVASPTGAFTPAGSLSDFTRGEHTATLMADGRVLILGGGTETAEVWDPATRMFIPAGALPRSRWGYSATALPDGRVLVAGGISRAQRRLPGAKLWDPATESFGPAGSLAKARESHAALLLPDGRVIIIGGCCQRGRPHATAEVWDPERARFGPAGSMSTRRSQFSATVLPDGRVLVVGGFAANGPAASAEVWDPATGDFGPAGSMAGGRVWHSATLLQDGRVLVLGGGTDVAEVWDPATMSFSPAGALPEVRDGFTMTLLHDGRVLVVGGEAGCADDYCDALSGAEAWDPTTMSFSPAGDLAQGRLGHSAVLLPDGRVLVFGGWHDESEGDYGVLTTAEVWDPATMSFSPAGALTEARRGYAEVALPDGRVLVSGGFDEEAEVSLGTAEIWDPTLSRSAPATPAVTMDKEAAEARLLSGVSWIRHTCKPKRTNLPGAAIAGVNCWPAIPAVRQVRLYLFGAQRELLDGYFAKLGGAGFDRSATDDEPAQPGRPTEGPYHPTKPDQHADYPYRHGCFIDRDGRAHYLATSPPYVLIEVIGRGDCEFVEDWAWDGNQDNPGSPTIWR